MLKYENIPYVIREKGITQTPIEVIARNGMVHFERMYSKYGKGNGREKGMLPVVFIDVRDIPITFHSHDYLEIVCVLEGRLLFKSRTDVVNLQKGDIWITNLYEEHALACYDGEAAIVNICIPRELLERGIFRDFYEEEGLLTSFLKDRDTRRPYLFFPYSENHVYKRIVDYILLEANTKRETDSHLKALILLLLAELSSATELKSGAPEGKMVEILSFMGQNYAHITMKDIAAHFNYTENYLTKLIKKSTGKNASSMLMEMRLSKACELLAETEESVEDIAYHVGYKSSGYFYNLFKKTYHITPREYRESRGF